jgi:hypothetical protein
MLCSFIISGRTRAALVDIDFGTGNLFDLVVIMMQAIVWLVVVLIRVLLRAIVVRRIGDTTAMLKEAQVMDETEDSDMFMANPRKCSNFILLLPACEEHWGRVAECACGAWKGCFGFWICMMNSTTLSELDSIPADEKRLRTDYAEVKSE